jgi:hypothetical protein
MTSRFTRGLASGALTSQPVLSRPGLAARGSGKRLGANAQPLHRQAHGWITTGPAPTTARTRLSVGVERPAVCPALPRIGGRRHVLQWVVRLLVPGANVELT